jgi:uracil-DNA glycosylase family 4
MNKEEQMTKLEEEMLKEEGKIGLGSGNLRPKFIILGQNPGKKLIPGTRVFIDPKCRGASSILLPVLEELGILKECFFDNVVKNTTVDNKAPSQEEVDKWSEYLKREIEILKESNDEAIIVALGNFANQVLTDLEIPHIKISHPLRTFYGYSIKEYKKEIKKVLNL